MFSLIKNEVNMFERAWTVKEEIEIMGMEPGKDSEWCMRPDVYEEMEERWIVGEYNEILEAKAKGQILNPYYDEDYTYRCWKYDRPIADPFIHQKWITKEELDAYNLSFELYRRMLDKKEADEDIEYRWNENAA